VLDPGGLRSEGAWFFISYEKPGPKKNGAGFPEFPRPARQLVPRIPPPGALRVTPAAPVVTPVVTPCSGMVGWDGT
jgi:hypothetical protein